MIDLAKRSEPLVWILVLDSQSESPNATTDVSQNLQENSQIMRQAIVPGLLLLITTLVGCGDSDSGSSSETVDLFLLDDVDGQTYRMEEQRTYRLRIYGGSYENSAVTSWQWTEQPVEAGAFSVCRDEQNFDVQLAAANLQGACTASANCSLSFDQVSSADSDSDGLSVFNVKVPVLKAPVGVKYRVEGTHEGGQIVASNHTFCLVSINEPPLASDDAYTVTEGVERVVGEIGGNLLTNDTDDIDESNQALTVTLVTAPTLSASFSLGTDGSFSYLYTGAVTGGQVLQDSFQYRVSDGFNSDVATVNLTIVTSDKSPELVNPIPAIVVESGVPVDVNLAANFIDPEGGDLFFSFADPDALPPSGNLVLTATGELTGTPTLADAGNYTITVIVTDQVSTIEAPLELTISENLPPSVSELSDVTVDFGQLISIDTASAFSDPEGIALSYRLQSDPVSGLSINSETGLITGQIATEGDFVITVFASDGINAEVSTSFSITQLPIPNRAPILLSEIPNQTIELGESITEIQPDFFDPDGDTLSYQITSEVPGLSFDADTGVLSGTPTQLLSLSINIVATDPDGLTANSNAFQLTVSEVPNQAPVFANNIATQSGNVGLSITPISGNFSDPEGESLVYSVTSLPAGLTVDPATGIITGTPTQTFSNTVTITATDPDGESISSNAFTLTISPALNGVPVLNSQIANVSVMVDEAASISTPASAFSDPDEDPLTYSLASNSGSLPPGMVLSALGTISGTPTQTGVFDGIIVQATDGSEATASNAFSITVTEQPNSAPEFSGPIPDVTRTVNEQTSVTTIAGEFSDPDQDSLVYSLSATSGALPVGLSLNSTGVIVGTPTQVGTSEGIVVVASDGELSDSSNAFSITISPEPNTAPEFDSTIASISATVGSEITVSSIAASFSDADDDPLTFSLAPGSGDLPPGIVLNPSGTLTGTPTSSGTFSGIQVEATDGSDQAVSNAFTIDVAEAPNSPPEFTGTLVDPAGTVGVAFALTTIAAQFSDVDNDELTFTLATNSEDLPPGLSLGNNGSITGTPTLDGSFDDIQISASDGEESVVSPAFSIVISPAPNSVPEFTGTIFNQTATVGVTFSLNTIVQRFNDDDGDSLTYTLAANSGDLPPGLSLSPAGAITGTPTLDGNFPSIRISASDGSAQAVSNAFRITVGPAPNSAPEFSGVIADVTGTVGETLSLSTIPSSFTDDDDDILTYVLASTSASLPTGFSLSPTGVLSGTTNSPVTVTGIIVEASDGSATAQSNPFDLTISDAPNATPEFSGTLPDISGTVGVSVNVTTIPNRFSDDDNDTLTYSLAATSADLPEGLDLSLTGTLSGIPENEESVIGVIVQASDGSDSVTSNAFDIIIGPAPNASPDFVGTIDDVIGTVDTTVTVTTIPAQFVDDDDLVFALADASSDLPSGFSLSPAGLLTGESAVPLTVDDIIVEATDGTDTAVSNSFSLIISAAPNSPPTFTGTVGTITRERGVATTITSIAAGFADDDGIETLTYALATGSEPLPAGLDIDSATGVISGTPITSGTTEDIIVSATDGLAVASTNPFSIIISEPANAPPEFSGNIADQSGSVGVPLSIDVVASEFTDTDVLTYTVAVQGADLPDGLALDSVTGEISGTPTTPGSTVGVLIEATDGIAVALSNAFDFVINTPPEFAGPITAQTGTDQAVSTFEIGTFFSDADGDVLLFSLSAISSELPDGLELDPLTGDIAGTPAAPGTVEDVQIEATDGVDSVVSNLFDIIIEPPV